MTFTFFQLAYQLGVVGSQMTERDLCLVLISMSRANLIKQMNDGSYILTEPGEKYMTLHYTKSDDAARLAKELIAKFSSPKGELNA